MSTLTSQAQIIQLLSQVLAVFPRGDARYTEAYKLLNELGAEEDDD